MCSPALMRSREGSDVLTPFPSLLISLFFRSLWLHLSNSAAAELSMKPVITARVAAHRTSQTLVNWGLEGEDIQLHMPPFVAANYWFEKCDLVSPSPSRIQGFIYLADQKVAALPLFFFFFFNFHCSLHKILLTFAHVNLPAAVFYCLRGDILEGSLRPTGELRSWWQSSDHFFLHLVPFSWDGYNFFF